MPSAHEAFWTHDRFAVVGHQAVRPFPKLTYKGLKASGKHPVAIDPSGGVVEGDTALPDFAALTEPVDGAVIEVPREETAEWVRKAGEAGIKRVWLHMNTDTPEALAAAREHDMDVLTGTCAVMYVTPGFTFHSIHKLVRKLSGKY